MIEDYFLLLSSGNRTPGSRSYCDLVDTRADSVCIHQHTLKPWHLKPARGSFQLMHDSSQNTLRIAYTSLSLVRFPDTSSRRIWEPNYLFTR